MQNSRKPLREIFAHNLKFYRNKKGYSQEFLAVKSGLHRTYISAVERGVRNISIDNMERVADALGVSIIKLLSSKQT